MGSETGLPRSRLLLLPPTALIWASSDALTRVTSKAMHDHPCRHGARDRDMLKQPVLERAVHWVHLPSCCSSGTDTYRSIWQIKT